MFANRLRVTKTAGDQLKALKQRTSVTPNILCRIALAISLQRGKRFEAPAIDLIGREPHKTTLLGEHTVLYECLLRQIYGDQSEKNFEALLAAHIEDGISVLKAARCITDLARIR